ncbi:MAG: hypothetical protein HQM13_06350 [SAR324 cluster bacterium]|nr:hypothetical protein [SAR324 cluster bacterium]
MPFLILILLSGLIQWISWIYIPLPWTLLAMNSGPLLLGAPVFLIIPARTRFATIYSYYLFSVAFLGPFATLGSLLAWGIVYSSQGRSLDAYYQQSIDSAGSRELERSRFQLTENLWAENESMQVAAFVDIMKGDDRMLKQNTIDKVVQRPSHLSIEILRDGLKDEDPDIRYYAASGLIQLNDMFQEKFNHLRDQTEQAPQDPEPWYELGVTYEHYAYWGVAAVDSLEENLNQAEAFLKQSLVLDPLLEKSYVTLGRLLTKRKKIDEALEFIRKGFEHFPDSVELMGWLAEALYEGKYYNELEDFSRECILKAEIPETLEKSFHHWAYTAPILMEHDRSLSEV